MLMLVYHFIAFSVFLEDCQYNYFVFTIIKHHDGTKHGGT